MRAGDGLKPGSYSVTAHERIVWGRPAAEAVHVAQHGFGRNDVIQAGIHDGTSLVSGCLKDSILWISRQY